jgi:DNA-directed RNA polymerase specialized sigma24 family protein
MEFGVSDVLRNLSKDRMSYGIQNLYIENCYAETMQELYKRWNHRLTQVVRTRLDFHDSLSADVAVHEIWLPLLARCVKGRGHIAIPWLFMLSRETAKFFRRNEKRSIRKRYRIQEAATIADFMLKYVSDEEADVFRCFYLDGGDYLEISHVTKIPPLQVSQMLARTRNLLQDEFQPPMPSVVLPKAILRLIGVKGILSVL